MKLPIYKTAMITVGSGLCWLLGGWDDLLIVLLFMLSADIVTGFIRGAYERKLSSAVQWLGIGKKVMTLSIVGVANILGEYLLHDDGLIRGMVMLFYISNEGLSLLENVAALGLPLPESLKNILAQLHPHKK